MNGPTAFTHGSLHYQNQSFPHICFFSYSKARTTAETDFWNVPASKKMREDIVARGRTRFRSVEDQLTLNEVIHTGFYEQVVVLPSQYNFRAHYHGGHGGWPRVESLDGVLIYHNSYCVAEAKKLIPVKAHAELPPLVPDQAALTDWQKFWRKIQLRRQSHIVR